MFLAWVLEAADCNLRFNDMMAAVWDAGCGRLILGILRY